MEAIDLFCGSGGTTTGLKKAGIDVVLGIDNDKTALKSYSANHPEVETQCQNILELSAKDLPDTTIITGSTPCQTFSLANRFGRVNDMTLTDHFYKIIADKKPKYWMLENVKQVRPFIVFTYRRFNRLQNAIDFGTPQNRTRLIAGNYPKLRRTHTPYPTHTLYEYTTKKHVYVSDIIPSLKGLWLYDQHRTKPGFETKAFFSADGPSRVVTQKKFGVATTPEKKAKKIRLLTCEEHALIQGFPEGYKFHGNQRQQMSQIGNAVPPQIAEAVGLACKRRP